jgi:hypothetical protein
MNKELGKIVSAKFGFGGYQEAMFGLSLEFRMGIAGGCGTFINGGWNNSIKSDECKWTEPERSKMKVEMCDKIQKILTDAKVSSVDELVNVPVELVFEDGMLKDWRVLNEVL